MHCVLNLETGGKEEDETQQVLLHAAHHFLFLSNQLNSRPDGYNQCLKNMSSPFQSQSLLKSFLLEKPGSR